MLVLHLIDALHRGGQCLKPVLRLLPVTLFDQLLHFGELLRSQHHLVAALRRLLTEELGPHAVERVAGACTVDGGAEPTEDEQRRGGRSDESQRGPLALAGVEAPAQCDGGVAGRDDHGGRGVANPVTPVREQERKFSFCGIGGVNRLA
ncbi:MAG: hypothetical protein JWP55_336 [Mycobacterium sp.]|nr:hypothetical protein [Mycobacterium sp.]